MQQLEFHNCKGGSPLFGIASRLLWVSVDTSSLSATSTDVGYESQPVFPA